jgi:hypothetical protein
MSAEQTVLEASLCRNHQSPVGRFTLALIESFSRSQYNALLFIPNLPITQ